MDFEKYYMWNPIPRGEMISDEDKGKKLKYSRNGFVFEADTIDLRNGVVNVTFEKESLFAGGHENPSISRYTSALVEFATDYWEYIGKHLNGARNLKGIKFNFFGFGCITLD